ncbi:MAG: metalloprotease TldD [Candidatus Binatia bacterium]|nr:metalloprotease TldD [Candidatus Binatia bacterium]MDG1957314.1 metalloprotease TldD [Candidatus Binatia bacterium]MDG2011446.1 metalloprotease TldD [Candidatus Binatia bacterium]
MSTDDSKDSITAIDTRFGLDARQLEQTLGTALARKSDFADLYFELRESTHVGLEEGLVKRANVSISQGVGVRVLAEEKTGYAYSDEITPEALELAAASARTIAHGSSAERRIAVRTGIASPTHNLYPIDAKGVSRPLPDRIDLLQKIDKEARKFDSRICNVMANLAIEEKQILVTNSEGTHIADSQPLVRVNVSCVAESGGKRETGNAGAGGRFSIGFYLDEPEQAFRLARDAARQAIVNLDAEEAPAGEMKVVLGPGWPGVLLHEAVGHGLEGDFNRKKTSAFADRIGDRVASELCTVVDDGAMERRRGSLNMDDEGTPTGRTVLIEKGRLRGYLQDRLNARLMGVSPTGNGRRESFMHAPLPRMTNTFMLSGEDDPGDILRSVDNGIYAVSFGGGQVDITNGKFVFSAREAYRIEGGKVGAPLKGVTLIGNGPDALTRISRVGNDLALDEGIGVCGKDGQSVPVGVGLPTIRLDGMTVGGTRT